MKTATLILDQGELFDRHGRPAHIHQLIYKMDPPYLGHGFILVSAATPIATPLVCLFGATQTGHVTDHRPLAGSQRGTLDYEQTLRALGYELRRAGERAA